MPSPEAPTSPNRHSFLVIALCAAWCKTCGEFRRGYEQLASRRRDAAFEWLDIEDDADIVGDIEVENFPTIAIFANERLVHFGVTLPQAQLVDRLLDSFDDYSKTISSEPDVVTLIDRLSTRLLAHDDVRRSPSDIQQR